MPEFNRQTCPPTQAPTGGTTVSQAGTSQASTPTTTTTTKNVKREVDKIKLTVVTNQAFNPSLNGNHLQVFKALVSPDYQRLPVPSSKKQPLFRLTTTSLQSK